MQELAWLIKNDVDLEKAQTNQFYRVPYLELGPLIPRIILEKVKKNSWKQFHQIFISIFPQKYSHKVLTMK